MDLDSWRKILIILNIPDVPKENINDLNMAKCSVTENPVLHDTIILLKIKSHALKVTSALLALIVTLSQPHEVTRMGAMVHLSLPSLSKQTTCCLSLVLSKRA